MISGNTGLVSLLVLGLCRRRGGRFSSAQAEGALCFRWEIRGEVGIGGDFWAEGHGCSIVPFIQKL